MKSIVFICPYFGKLPKSQISLWLKTCKSNYDIDWFIITDDKTKYQLPNNVFIKYMSFEEMKSRIQEKFPFKIEMNSAYKLCDFKPLYGFLFPEIVNDYEYWGHCDLSDTLFGNLQHFFLEEKIKNYDKILFLGHMTLYKNTKEVNERFKLVTKSGKKLEEIIGSADNMAFDELNSYSINQIYLEKNFPLLRIDEMYADICDLYYKFRLSCYDSAFKQYLSWNCSRIFEWDRGKLYDCSIDDKKLNKREIGYVHFQKRKIEYLISQDCDHFYLIPNKIIPADKTLTIEMVEQFSKNKIFYKKYFELKYEALKYHIRNILK